MKLFLYKKDDLTFVPFSVKHKVITFITFISIGLLSFSSGIVYLKSNPQFIELEREVMIINPVLTDFSEDEMISLMKEWNIKFPHIVMAQSMLETNQFTSAIFMENHNLFGMKEAAQRIHLAKGTNRNHAYYDSWVESLLDYAFYQSHYLSKIRTESQYFDYLSKHYAEDSKYVDKLKRVIKENNLKEKF